MKHFGIIILLIICSSCDKWFDNLNDKYAVCHSNCTQLSAKGSIVDLTKNIGVAGIPVTLRWTSYKYLISPEYIIDVKSTDNNGDFSFRNAIDTSFFSKGYFLTFILSENPNYIMYPNYSPITVQYLNSSIIDNLKFNLYRKAQLHIQLERVEKDSFEVFIVEHTFFNPHEYNEYVDFVNSPIGNNQYENPLNTTINAETASDMKTYIKLRIPEINGQSFRKLADKDSGNKRTVIPFFAGQSFRK